ASGEVDVVCASVAMRGAGFLAGATTVSAASASRLVWGGCVRNHSSASPPAPKARAEDDPEMALEGIHHITAITGDAPRNVDFYARLLGLRLVKKTVNFDAPDVYHL